MYNRVRLDTYIIKDGIYSSVDRIFSASPYPAIGSIHASTTKMDYGWLTGDKRSLYG